MITQDKSFIESMVAEGVATYAQIESASVSKETRRSRSILRHLIDAGTVNEEILVAFLRKQLRLSVVSLNSGSYSEKLRRLVPPNVCEKYRVIPFRADVDDLHIATADPTDQIAQEALNSLTRMNIVVHITKESSILSTLRNSSGESSDLSSYQTSSTGSVTIEPREFVDKEGTSAIEIGVEKESRDLENSVDTAPVIRMINSFFIDAIGRGASDIHIEPHETHSKLRFRIDGTLQEVGRVPTQFRNALPARIKVMSQLDISERRLPQDGRLQVKARGKKVDVRISIFPTLLGEKVCMRLLVQNSTPPSIDQIGLEASQLRCLQHASSLPHGMILVTGPTGSGKSTTLYSLLSGMNSDDVNISTIEDPVEYRLDGVTQGQIKESIGMTFAKALRSLLRQDPDIIMVGEIRDQETADISVKAALTGHLVLSTLHTNDAASTLSRLSQMGVEPFLISSAVNVIVAQRLIRVICPDCTEDDIDATPEKLTQAGVPNNWLAEFVPKRGKGCATCGNTGFKGRCGIFEVLRVTAGIRNLILNHANTDELKRVAAHEGMITLRQSACIKLFQGTTSLAEVLYATRSDEE